MIVSIGPDNLGYTYVFKKDDNQPSGVAMETFEDDRLHDIGDAGQALEAESTQDPETGKMTVMMLATVEFLADLQ